jgi:hypothetical protein
LNKFWVAEIALIASLVVVTGCAPSARTNDDSKRDTGRPNVEGDRKMKALGGHVAITNLPPHRGMIVYLAFFKVDGPQSVAPYNGDPPTDVVTDCPELYNKVDLEVESRNTSCEIPFSIKHAAGHYYIQVRALLFRKHDGKVLAQSEQFFFGRRPLSLLEDLPSVTLPVEWPSIPVEDLNHYGEINPRKP